MSENAGHMPSSPQRDHGWLPGHGPGGEIVRGIVEGQADIAAIEQYDPGEIVAGNTIYDCLSTASRLNPDKTAVIAMRSGQPGDPVRTLTYAEYLANTTRAANLFHAIADGDQSVVAIMLPILPETLVAAWGATTAGQLNTVNPHLEPDMVAAILRSVRATVLVTTTAHGSSAADRLDAIISKVPTLRRILMVDGDGGDDDFATAIAAMPGNQLDFAAPTNPFAICTYLPTGGTTAMPKLARLTHRGMVLNAWIGGAIMGAAEDEVVGIGMPLFHVGGLIMLALRSAILGQTALLLTPGGFRDRGIVDHFWSHVRAHGLTALIATPTTASALLNNVNHNASTGHTIRTFTCGGSTVPIELGTRFPETFGVHLREVWGATEFHGFLGCQPNGIAPLIGSVGLRTPWHEVKAVALDEDNRFLHEMPAGERGVIIGRGPCVSEGYLDPSLDDGFFVSGMPDGERWGSSGDLGRVDVQGYIWIDGRAKDVIIRGGHNIDPKPIEEALCRHAAVLHAAAIGQPDAAKGELPVAYVELVAGKNVEEEELLAYCRDHLPERAGQPVAITVIKRMPLTPVGKIFKPALRDDAIRRVVDSIVRDHCGAAGRWLIDIPETRGRPMAVVTVEGADDARLDSLRVALAPFHFDTRVDRTEAGVTIMGV